MRLSFIPRIIGVFVVLLAIYQILKEKEISKNPFPLMYVIFVVWVFTSFAFSSYTDNPSGLLTLVQVALVTFAISIITKTVDDFYNILKVYFVSIFFVFFQNLDYFYLSNLSRLLTEENRFAGSLANANTAALYSVSIIWVGSVLLLKSYQRFVPMMLTIIGTAIAFLFVIYSGSRKGFLGLILLSFALSSLIIRNKGKSVLRKIGILIISLSGLLLVAFSISASPFFNRLIYSFGNESSSLKRAYLFNEAISMWMSSPKNFIFGIGINNFEKYTEFHTYSHSTISELLVCTGVVGFILYSICIFTIVVGFISLNRSQSGSKYPLIGICIIFIFLFILFNLFAVMYSDRLFWPLLGVISSLMVIYRKGDIIEA